LAFFSLIERVGPSTPLPLCVRFRDSSPVVTTVSVAAARRSSLQYFSIEVLPRLTGFFELTKPRRPFCFEERRAALFSPKFHWFAYSNRHGTRR